MNENNCPCCDKKWTSNKITNLKESSIPKWFLFGWIDGFFVTYHLVCTDCNIETDYTKFIKKEDFKPECENKEKSS